MSRAFDKTWRLSSFHPPRAPKRRDVYLPDEHYTATTAQLQEWQARACDLCYLTSQRPGDVLALEEENIVGDEIHLVQAKTGTAMVIEMNSTL